MTAFLKPTTEDFLKQGKKEVLESILFNNVECTKKKWEEIFSLIFAHLPRVYKCSNAFIWAESFVQRGIEPNLDHLDLMVNELQMFLDLGASAKLGMLSLDLYKIKIDHNNVLNINSNNLSLGTINQILVNIQIYLDLIEILDVIDLKQGLNKQQVFSDIIDFNYNPTSFLIALNSDQEKLTLSIENDDVINILNRLKKEIIFAKKHYKKGFETL
jgi:hypothetical protein